MKKLLILSIFFFLTMIIPIACVDDDCGNIRVKNFEIIQMGIMTVSLNNQDPLDTTLTYPAADIGKLIFIEETQEVATVEQRFFSLFINSAYACSPIEPHAIHDILSIDIISNRKLTYADENDIIEINENINDRFLIAETVNFPENFFNINQFLSKEREIFPYEKFLLKTVEEPFQPVTLGFDIVMTMSDGTIFEFKDQIMKIE